MNKIAFALMSLLATGTALAGDQFYTRVPEPGTLALLAMGVAGIAAVRLGRRK